MSVLADLKMYGRFAWGLRGFLRHAITLKEARAIVRRRMAEREDAFLRIVEKGIYGYLRSPYLPLLKLAGCELGDIQTMVHRDGLEDTLRALREAGVYVTFEEFKGREPIVRDGHVYTVEAGDFDSPHLSRYYEAESAGTTGAGTRIAIDLGHLAAQAPSTVLTHDAHGILGVPVAIWFDVLPASTGTSSILQRARAGQIPEKWFSPVVDTDFRPSLRNRLATRTIVAAGRMCGAPLPRPEAVRLDQAAVVARWAARALKTHGKCLVVTHVSLALRVCIAAREEGLDLMGAVFWGGGEPPTPAKIQQVTQVGARWIPSYWFSEVGAVGLGCARPTDVNDLHFLKDCLALIQYPRPVPGTDITVDAFHFTTLLPTAPKLLLNVESDDYGVIEERSCGCLLEACGYKDHLRHVRSFRKLTAEGMTLVGSEMVRILEEMLPARFGGSPLDYQLLEEEDRGGFSRLSLLISPEVEIADEAQVIEGVLEALRQGSVASDLARVVWGQAKTLRVRRQEPIWTARGKLMPLHLAQRAGHSKGAATDRASLTETSLLSDDAVQKK
jgi:hypothetical protein